MLTKIYKTFLKIIYTTKNIFRMFAKTFNFYGTEERRKTQ